MDRYNGKALMSGKYHDSEPPKRWIQEVVSSPKFKKGAFTKQAKEAGKTTKEMMKDVLAHPEEYSERTRKRAQFLANIRRKES